MRQTFKNSEISEYSPAYIVSVNSFRARIALQNLFARVIVSTNSEYQQLNLFRYGHWFIGTCLADCWENFVHNPWLEFLRWREFWFHNQAVQISLIYVWHWLNTTRCRGVTFRYSLAVVKNGFSRIAVSKCFRNICSNKIRFPVNFYCSDFSELFLIKKL